MEKSYAFSEIEFEELDPAIMMDGTTYTLSRATSFPDGFLEDSRHCDVCALYEKCHCVIPSLNVCGILSEMIDLNPIEEDRLFFD